MSDRQIPCWLRIVVLLGTGLGISACDNDGSEAVTPMVSQHADGMAVYERQCLACHGADGRGRPRVFPPLLDNARELARREGGREYLMQVALNGVGGAITVDGETYRGAMPGFAHLSDAEIASVLTHITRAGAGEPRPDPAVQVFRPEQVADLRERSMRPGEVRAIRPAGDD